MQCMVAFVSFYLIFTLSGLTRGNLGLQMALAASTEEKSKGSEKTPPTASDQSENEADRKITQQIRQAVTKDDSLSTSAQNVKIITQDGKVTLRGTVKNENEKQKIGEMAKKASGVRNIENLLTVSK
jgi:hyperosmotically inducible periplasmic protein